jgi:cyclopropane-fatty-acyl-phospholipid synthase
MSPPSEMPRTDRGSSLLAESSHIEVDERVLSLLLGESLNSSSGMWLRRGADDPCAEETIDLAQDRNVDWFAEHCAIGRDTRLLDIDCGWGGTLVRLVRHHGLADGIGLTLSPTEARYARTQGLSGIEIRDEGWETHQPNRPYDVILSLEPLQPFTDDGVGSHAEKAQQPDTTFFERCAEWLSPGGCLGLHVVCAAGSGPHHVPEQPRIDIVPGAVPFGLADMCAAWEPLFELDYLTLSLQDAAMTCRKWLTSLHGHRAVVTGLVGTGIYEELWRRIVRLEGLIEGNERSVYRVLLTKRRRRKS